MRSRVHLWLLAVMVIVAACSEAEPGQQDTTTTIPTTTTSDDAPTTTPAASLSIRMAAFAFSGDETGKVGDTVRVVNDDDFSHTWTSTDQAFHSGTLGPGEEFFHTFEQPGTYGYFCQIHPEMGGTITIES